jgi:hypothetical protein
MNDPNKTIERHLHVLKDDQSPLKSPNTALVAAATTSGILLSEEQPFVQTIEMKEGEPRRQTVWCLKDMEIEFLPEFPAEKITTAEFVRRFRDPQWRQSNPHHPIAYLAWFHETNQRLLEKVRENKALLMVRRGNRIAFIPQGSDAATRDKILALL